MHKSIHRVRTECDIELEASVQDINAPRLKIFQYLGFFKIHRYNKELINTLIKIGGKLIQILYLLKSRCSKNIYIYE